MTTVITDDISLSEFNQENPILVIDFYADWCGPCKVMGPIFEELSNQFPEAQFLKVNVDGTALHTQFGVRGIPAFVIATDIFNGQTMLNKVAGMQSKDQLTTFIRTTIDNHNNPQVQ